MNCLLVCAILLTQVIASSLLCQVEIFFYVFYFYVYYDPRNNQKIPIYVGKGKGKRLYSHLKESICENSILKAKIQQIDCVIECVIFYV